MPSKLLPFSRRQLDVIAATMLAERGWPRWVTLLLTEVGDDNATTEVSR